MAENILKMQKDKLDLLKTNLYFFNIKNNIS